MKLALATPEQQLQRDHLSYEAWGPPLTLPQYLERERCLRAHRFSRQGLQTWLLTDGPRVLASCETYRMAGQLGALPGPCWGVASVFTERALRGKGYATELMNGVGEQLSAVPGALASTLYSDVGAAIYERSGYRAFPGQDWVFSPLPGEPAAHVEPLDDAHAPAPPAVADGLVITPTAAQLDWHFERERLYSRLLGRPGLAFHVARAAQATLWCCAYLRTSELLVLWLDAKDAAAAAPLVECARRLAAQAGLHRLRLWQTIDLSTLPAAQLLPRSGELPMVRALQPGVEKWSSIQRALWV